MQDFNDYLENRENELLSRKPQEVEQVIEDSNQKGSVGILVLGLLLTIIGLSIVIISVVTTIKAV